MKKKSDWWVKDKAIRYIEQGFDSDEAMDMALNEAMRRIYKNNPYSRKKKNRRKYKRWNKRWK